MTAGCPQCALEPIQCQVDLNQISMPHFFVVCSSITRCLISACDEAQLGAELLSVRGYWIPCMYVLEPVLLRAGSCRLRDRHDQIGLSDIADTVLEYIRARLRMYEKS